MSRSPQPGDHVSWQTSQGKTEGKVEKKVTGTAWVQGHKAAASKDEPQYLVKSDKSGKEALHKASALTRSRRK